MEKDTKDHFWGMVAISLYIICTAGLLIYGFINETLRPYAVTFIICVWLLFVREYYKIRKERT